MFYIKNITTLLGVFFIIGACHSTKKLHKEIIEDAQTLAEKVNACTNNQERLYTLLQGNYILHGIPPWDSVITLWRSQTSGDSILTAAHPVEEPSKHGYLLLYGMYFTQIPDEPLSSFLINVEQVSRDTLVLWSYSCRNFTLEEMLDKKIEEELNLKTFIDTSNASMYGIYVKENNTKFNFHMPRRKYPYSGGNPNRAFRELEGHINLNFQESKSIYYNDGGTQTEVLHNFYIRRHNLDLRKWCAVLK